MSATLKGKEELPSATEDDSSSTQIQSQTRMAGLWLRQNVAKPVENFFMSMPCLGQR